MYPPPIELISASDINDYHIEEKNDGDDKNSFKDHRYDEHHRDAGLALALLTVPLPRTSNLMSYSSLNIECSMLTCRFPLSLLSLA